MSTEKEFFIAGVQHHQISQVCDLLSEGDALDLIPEPTNKFDPNAIHIEYRDTMLGYVPRKFSAEVSAMIEVGDNLECTIIYLDKTAKPWEMCKVKIVDLDFEDKDEEEDEEEY